MTNEVNEKKITDNEPDTIEESDIPSDVNYRNLPPNQKVNTLAKPQTHVPGGEQPVEYIANQSSSTPVVRPHMEAKTYDTDFSQAKKKVKDIKKELKQLSFMLVSAKKNKLVRDIDKFLEDINKLEKELTYSFSENMTLEELMSFLHEDLEK